jgi:dipeptidyl aminopeptidase/acylaminoacyl peptidase
VWAPDGRSLAFASDRFAQPERRWLLPGLLPRSLPADLPADLRRRAQEEGEARALTEAGAHAETPVWAPDGRSLAFASDRSGAGGSSRGFSPGPCPRTCPRTCAAVHRRRSAVTRSWTVPAAGGEARALTEAGAHAETPVWAPDGRSLAFASDPRAAVAPPGASPPVLARGLARGPAPPCTGGGARCARTVGGELNELFAGAHGRTGALAPQQVA